MSEAKLSERGKDWHVMLGQRKHSKEKSDRALADLRGEKGTP